MADISNGVNEELIHAREEIVNDRIKIKNLTKNKIFFEKIFDASNAAIFSIVLSEVVFLIFSGEIKSNSKFLTFIVSPLSALLAAIFSFLKSNKNEEIILKEQKEDR